MVELDDLLEGAKISVTWKTDADEPVTKEGSVVAVNESMLLIKPRGAMLGELIHRANIVELTQLDEVPKLLIRKLRIIKPTEARQHLADRHGYHLDHPDLINDMTAFRAHEAIDHATLSHIHEDKEESPRAEAIEAAATDEGDE